MVLPVVVVDRLRRAQTGGWGRQEGVRGGMGGGANGDMKESTSDTKNASKTWKPWKAGTPE